MSKRFREAARNYAATMGFLILGNAFYSNAPHFARFFSGTSVFGSTGWSVTTLSAFDWIVWTYAIILVPYYVFTTGESSASRFVRGILAKRFDENWKKAGRSLALKAFFAPLMVGWLISHAAATYRGFEEFFLSGTFEWASAMTMPFYVFAFQAVLFADVFFFTAGYLVEADELDNRIVSVDPTVSWWFVCLLCYPPFNGATEAFFGWHSSDHPAFSSSPEMTAVLNFTVIGLMAFYAWASVALGWKASNLTNRGIVANGPYKWVRHPAYAAKNLSWWVGAIPAVVAAWGTGKLVFVFLSLAAWSGIYYLRAVTEERHLLMADNGYAEYREKVSYRFVPGVW